MPSQYTVLHRPGNVLNTIRQPSVSTFFYVLGLSQNNQSALVALGRAMAANNRPLIYGGGSKGIMGTISGSVLENGGKVTGITPYAMVADKISPKNVGTNEKGREKVAGLLSLHVLDLTGYLM